MSQICSVLLSHTSWGQRNNHLSPSTWHQLAKSSSKSEPGGARGEDPGGAGELFIQRAGNWGGQEDQQRRRRNEGRGGRERRSTQGQSEKSVSGGGAAGIWPQPGHLHRLGHQGRFWIMMFILKKEVLVCFSSRKTELNLKDFAGLSFSVHRDSVSHLAQLDLATADCQVRHAQIRSTETHPDELQFKWKLEISHIH